MWKTYILEGFRISSDILALDIYLVHDTSKCIQDARRQYGMAVLSDIEASTVVYRIWFCKRGMMQRRTDVVDNQSGNVASCNPQYTC